MQCKRSIIQNFKHTQKWTEQYCEAPHTPQPSSTVFNVHGPSGSCVPPTPVHPFNPTLSYFEAHKDCQQNVELSAEYSVQVL